MPQHEKFKADIKKDFLRRRDEPLDRLCVTVFQGSI